MRSMEISFCLILMITVTATYGDEHESHDYDSNLLYGNEIEKRIVKRDASIIIDSYPSESAIKRRPRVLIKRVSRGRHQIPKPKYGPPKKPLKRSRRPYQKKYKKPMKYPPPGYKKRPHTKTKARRTRPRPSKPPKPQYGPPKHVQQSYKPPEPDDFAVTPPIYPPLDTIYPPKPDNGEPPVDSYGAPLRPNGYPLAESLPEPQLNDYNNHDKDHAIWPDQNLASSNKHHVFAKPDVDVEDLEQMPIDFDDNLDPFPQHLRGNENYELIVDAEKNKRLSHRQKEKRRFISRPWKLPEFLEEKETKIMVGGQYAEPPAKYVGEDDSFVPPKFIDSEIPASATMSPYVNYKNSNMAFSPQNLNDAFSLIDK